MRFYISLISLQNHPLHPNYSEIACAGTACTCSLVFSSLLPTTTPLPLWLLTLSEPLLSGSVKTPSGWCFGFMNGKWPLVSLNLKMRKPQMMAIQYILYDITEP